MKQIFQILLIWVSFYNISYSQSEGGVLRGKVFEVNANNEKTPIIGANIYWLRTTKGTTTDVNGNFELLKISETSNVIISYVGYQSDTIDAATIGFIKVQMTASVDLEQIEVVHHQKTTEISFINPIKIEKIGSDELLKAACCNLSESFETNPSVDVSFTDAITGTKQIQMLGLAGPYTQITRENMPYVRGLSAIYGLTFIPGSWIESIQLNKGMGSVVNGYEGIAGQINAELRKSDGDEKLYFSSYTNEGGRFEGNLVTNHQFNKKLSTGLSLHGVNNKTKQDRNNDGFLDHPLSTAFIGLNRWRFKGEKGLRLQFGMEAVSKSSIGGQLDFAPATDLGTTNNWGMDMNLNRIQGWGKVGKISVNKPWQSFGLQFSGSKDHQNAFFGLNNYTANETVFYSNLIYQNIIKTTDHSFRTGLSLLYDNSEEVLNDSSYLREEMVSGGYFEYTYKKSNKFAVVAGLRGDYHNSYGAFVTPRLHLRYSVNDNLVVRGSAGRGWRSPNIIAENKGLFASSRQIIIKGENNDNPFGLKPEIANNYGINITQHFQLGYRDGNITCDLYKTDFESQVVVDLDQSPQKAVFYNLKGKSYSYSFQLQLDYELIKFMDVRIAYRWYDVKISYDDELRTKPLISSERAFINIGYKTIKQLKFDCTLNWQGKKRIPSTILNPIEFQLDEESPDFIVINAQVSKTWKDKFEVYLGAENLLDFKQKNPILDSDNPFGEYFDSSMVWGPIFGRIIYFGIRYTLKRKQ